MGDTDLTGGMVDLVDTDRRESDGCRELVAKKSRGRVTRVGVDEHPRDDLMAVEGGSIGIVRPVDAGVAGRIVPSSFAKSLPSLFLDLVWISVEGVEFPFVRRPEHLSLHEGPLWSAS